jgi:hypothetical protein
MFIQPSHTAAILEIWSRTYDMTTIRKKRMGSNKQEKKEGEDYGREHDENGKE